MAAQVKKAPGRRRPDFMKPEVRKAILDAVSIGCTFHHAAARAKVTKQTFREWRRRGEAGAPGDEDYIKFVEELRYAEGEGVYAAMIRVRAGKPGWQASAWMLERRYPQDYGRINRSELEVSGPGGGPVTMITGADAISRLEVLLATGSGGEKQ
jgi:transposase